VTATVTAGAAQAALQDGFPLWNVWRSGGGWWWATRRGDVRPRRDRDPGWAMTIDAGSPEELHGKLTDQEKLR
jgi:hypothetical protein